jgi:dihydroxy-acid dehydratase
MYTANTMAVAIEALGLSLPYSSSLPPRATARPTSAARRRGGAAAAREGSQAARHPDAEGVRERDDDGDGGRRLTNAVLHLLAIARTAGVPLVLEDFQRQSDRVPLLADLKPSGRYVQEDLHNIGGTPALMKYLLAKAFCTATR